MDRIEHLEALSKLKLSEIERKSFESEFDSVLEFVDEISKLELPEGLEKDRAVPLEELRADEPHESMERSEIMQNAPKQKDGEYVTPLVIE